jgi:glycosyltransferase involved in cell wall biosynthesis
MNNKQISAKPTVMRIALVNEFFYPDNTGGTGTVLSDLVKQLRSTYPDVVVDVITSRNLYRNSAVKLDATEIWDGVRIARLNTPHPAGSSTLRRLTVNAMFGLAALWKLVWARRYDLVIIGTAPPTLAMTAFIYKHLARMPYIYVVYDLDPDRAIKMGLLSKHSTAARLLHRAQKCWLNSASKTVVLGRCMREHVAVEYQVPRSQIEVIPIGADPQEIVPGKKQSRFREKHSLKGFVVAYSGNFGRYHNFDTILDAAKILLRANRPCTFVLCGDGAQRSHIESRVADEQIDNVLLCPFVAKEDYPDALAAADVSIVTLEPGMEGLCVPSKFYSILASGRPVLALVSPRSEVARVIDEEECGLQVNHGDTTKLVEAISFLHQNPDHAALMGKNARRALVERFSLQRTADQYYRVIRSVHDSLSDRAFEYSLGEDAAPADEHEMVAARAGSDEVN